MNHSNFGDLDGDGDIDLIIGNTRENPYYDGRKVSILLNDGAGNFSDATSYFTSIHAEQRACYRGMVMQLEEVKVKYI